MPEAPGSTPEDVISVSVPAPDLKQGQGPFPDTWGDRKSPKSPSNKVQTNPGSGLKAQNLSDSPAVPLTGLGNLSQKFLFFIVLEQTVILSAEQLEQ